MRQGDYFHSPICFVFKKSSLYELKVSRLHLSFKILWCPQRNWTHSKNELHETFGCWSSDMLNFDFSEKPGTVFFTTHGLSFFRKICFHVLFYNWPNVIAWLPLLYEIMSSMCITIICFPDCSCILANMFLCETLSNIFFWRYFLVFKSSVFFSFIIIAFCNSFARLMYQ